ncbi:ABC transporter permease [Verminephrobacter aporrectodeae]|uniref:ABC transporter permease n=1 Tax=Verminephrobacter aporrectodeae TaxID=1110389 RepID=UPI002237C07B|nr:ABC transporter permease [Verminephrobacter aporrectodeae]
MDMPDPALSASAAGSSRRIRTHAWLRSGGPGGLLALLLLLCAGFSIALPDRFPTWQTVESILLQVPELGLLALAMLLPLISGGINLAIIASTNMAALAMAWVLTGGLGDFGGQVGLAIAVAMLLGGLLCLVVGVLSGWLVANMQAHPILVTLGTMSLVNGVCVWLTRGKPIAGFPEEFQMIGSLAFFGIPLPFWIFMGASVLLAIYLGRTRYGLAVYMLGSNLEATRYCGVNTRHVLIGVYTLSTLLCWIAAILMMARFNSASAGYAQSYLLVTVLAAVLGGVDPFGGFGKVSGLFVALLVLQVISSGVNLLGVNAQLTQAMWGATMVGVMAVRYLAERRREQRAPAPDTAPAD